jgi:hypothetical protein
VFPAIFLFTFNKSKGSAFQRNEQARLLFELGWGQKVTKREREEYDGN